MQNDRTYFPGYTAFGISHPQTAALVPDSLGLTVDRILQQTVRWCKAVQNLDGGLPTDGLGSPSCSWTTAGLIWANCSADMDAEHEPGWVRHAAQWLVSQINPDGGLPILWQGDPSIIDATAHGILTLTSVNYSPYERHFATAIDGLVVWLIESQLSDGSWPWRFDTNQSCTTSTSLAILSLSKFLNSNTGLHSKAISEAIERAVDWLLRARNSDNGWGAEPGDVSRPAITGHAMIALQSANLTYEANFSIAFISTNRTKYGWTNVIDRQRGHTVTRLGTPSVITALALNGGTDALQLALNELHTLIATFDGESFKLDDSIVRSWPTRDGILALSVIKDRILSEKALK